MSFSLPFHLMDKKLRKYYYAFIVSHILWSPLVLHLISPTIIPKEWSPFLVATGIAGLVLNALLQHWAYYDIYNPKTRLHTMPVPRS